MRAKTVVLATRNKGKIRELSSLLSPFNLEVIGLDSFPDLPEVLEDGLTFDENALKKARETAKATGLAAIADDSGLEVDALGKAPGVYSARYSATSDAPATDRGNMEKLLKEMAATPKTGRAARFRCSMAACTPEGECILVNGTWEGVIADKPAGEKGFGYDPVFFIPELGKTAAQLESGEKNRLSHRAAACKSLLEAWSGFAGKIR